MKKVKAALEVYWKASQHVVNAILEEMTEVAKKNAIDRMEFLGNTAYFHNGKEVECEELDDLENIFCDEINSNGFQAVWTKEEGWM